MKKTEPIKTAEELFPACNKVATEIAKSVIRAIQIRKDEFKSDEPYSQQCTLELVISKLERAV